MTQARTPTEVPDEECENGHIVAFRYKPRGRTFSVRRCVVSPKGGR